MKLRSEFITHSDGDNQIIIDVSSRFNGIIRSNKTAAEIVELLKNDTTEAEITKKMLDKYDAPEEVIAADVNKIIEKLRSIDAIEG